MLARFQSNLLNFARAQFERRKDEACANNVYLVSVRSTSRHRIVTLLSSLVIFLAAENDWALMSGGLVNPMDQGGCTKLQRGSTTQTAGRDSAESKQKVRTPAFRVLIPCHSIPEKYHHDCHNPEVTRSDASFY